MNSLMQGSGGPWESVSLSVGSNYNLCAWYMCVFVVSVVCAVFMGVYDMCV